MTIWDCQSPEAHARPPGAPRRGHVSALSAPGIRARLSASNHHNPYKAHCHASISGGGLLHMPRA